MKPCPFCGSSADVSFAGETLYFVYCMNCHVGTAVRATREDAIEVWNSRAGSAAATPQPPPQANERPHIADLVIEDIKRRKAAGMTKYGTPLQAFNGRDALKDAYDEVLDQAQYIKQELEERAEREDALRREGAVAALRWAREQFEDEGMGRIVIVIETKANLIESGEVTPWTK